MTINREVQKSKLQSALFPFQCNAVNFMYEHPRCLNASEMGTGKTLEALALVERIQARHVLIVCPKTLISEWFIQCCRWSDGDMLTPNDEGDRLDGLDLKGPHYVCVNYDLLSNRNYWAKLASVPWSTIIFDEAHKLKNPKTLRTRYAFLLRAPRIIFMSGTPLQNSPADLYPLFHMINPRDYHSVRQWNNYFCVQIEQEIYLKNLVTGKPTPRIIRSIVPGKINHTEQLNVLLHKYMHRDAKKDVLKELPEKTYRVVPIDLGPERRQYESMRTELFAMLDSGEQITAPRVISQLIRLRQITLEPNLLAKETEKVSTPSNKTKALMDIVEGTDEKIVVFSYFAQYINIIAQELTKRKIKYVVVHGQIDTTERGRAVQSFQNDPSVQVFLGTIGAAGEGLTLTAAHICIFTDKFFNPAVNWQAEDRLHRIGQKNPVTYITLYAQNTVDQHISEIVQSKEIMFTEVVVKNVIDAMRKELK